jgi:DNA polymerase-1
VDGHAYAYRAFHAIRRLTSPTGGATNAIFGFIKMFQRARAVVEPTHLAVVWDGGLDAERVGALPDYKAHRPEMPADLESQLDPIGHYLEAAGLLSLCQDGVEADDLIGTLAVRANAQGCAVVIATSDKDFMQLVSPSLQLLNPGDKEQPLWGVDEVRRKTGVRPEQVVDWLSLVGDSVDNIAGVRGVGPKTAAGLLDRFGSVDVIYARLPEIESERLRQALAEARDQVERNRWLVRLRCDLGSAPDLVACRPGPEDRGRLRALFEGWGFRSLAAHYAAVEEQGSLF